MAKEYTSIWHFCEQFVFDLPKAFNVFNDIDSNDNILFLWRDHKLRHKILKLFDRTTIVPLLTLKSIIVDAHFDD